MRSVAAILALVALVAISSLAMASAQTTGTICDRYTAALGLTATNQADEYALVDTIVKRAVFGVANVSSTIGTRGTFVLLKAAVTGGPAVELRSASNFGAVERTLTITGINAATTLRALDRRANNSMFYALGSDSQLYMLDIGTAATAAPTSIAAVKVGDVSNPDRTSGATAIGMDFNPVGDALRIVQGAKNFRVSPATGNPAGGPAGAPLADGTAAGGTLQFVAGDVNAGKTPNAVATAYTNSVAPSPRDAATLGTAQYSIVMVEGTNAFFVQQAPPNVGDLATKGPLGIAGTIDADTATLDAITGADGVNHFIAMLRVDGVHNLYEINVNTGAATSIFSLGATDAANAYSGLSFMTQTTLNNAINNPLNAVTGILNMPSNLPYFNGQFKFKGAATPVFTNGGAPLTTLLDHLVKFFGSSSALACTATGFPAYDGVANMNTVHASMNITQAIFTDFNNQVLTSATSFGVSAADGATVAGVLNSFGRGVTNSICTQADCACANGGTGATCAGGVTPGASSTGGNAAAGLSASLFLLGASILAALAIRM